MSIVTRLFFLLIAGLAAFQLIRLITQFPHWHIEDEYRGDND